MYWCLNCSTMLDSVADIIYLLVVRMHLCLVFNVYRIFHTSPYFQYAQHQYALFRSTMWLVMFLFPMLHHKASLHISVSKLGNKHETEAKYVRCIQWDPTNVFYASQTDYFNRCSTRRYILLWKTSKYKPNTKCQLPTNGKPTEMSRGFAYSTAHVHLFTNYFC